MFDLFKTPAWREQSAAILAREEQSRQWSRRSWAFADTDARNGESIAPGEAVVLGQSSGLKRGLTARKAGPDDLPHCRPCETCNRPTRPAEIGRHSRKRVLCCENCRRQWRAGKRRHERAELQDGRALIRCEICTSEFKPARSDAKCCSNRCRQAAFRCRRNA